jgi:hypothetical protein
MKTCPAKGCLTKYDPETYQDGCPQCKVNKLTKAGKHDKQIFVTGAKTDIY